MNLLQESSQIARGVVLADNLVIGGERVFNCVCAFDGKNLINRALSRSEAIVLHFFKSGDVRLADPYGRLCHDRSLRVCAGGYRENRGRAKQIRQKSIGQSHLLHNLSPDLSSYLNEFRSSYVPLRGPDSLTFEARPERAGALQKRHLSEESKTPQEAAVRGAPSHAGSRRALPVERPG